MKKNLMFFMLGVSTTLLMGAGMSYWNQISQSNKYGVWVNDKNGMLSVPNGNQHGVWLNDRYGMLNVHNDNLYGVWLNDKNGMLMVPNDNQYGILVNDKNGMLMVPNDNQYALICEGEIGDDVKKAMAVGFIHGMAVGRKKAKEEDQKKRSTSNGAWGFP